MAARNELKMILELFQNKNQLLDMQWNFEDRKQWVKENKPRLLEWNSREIKGHYVIIKGCLNRISKKE